MKAIGHQIRFICRIEQALHDKQKLKCDSDPDDDNTEIDSPKATSPLLASGSEAESSKRFPHYPFSRQRNVAKPDRELTLLDNDYSSD